MRGCAFFDANARKERPFGRRARAMSLALGAHLLFGAPSAHADPDADRKAACVKSYEEAQVLRRASRLRAARRELLTCQHTCPPALGGDCQQWLEDTDRRMPTIVVVARGADGSNLQAFTVAQDAEAEAEPVDGGALAVDPGTHVLRIAAAGEVVMRVIALAEGEKDRRVYVQFEPPAPPVERSAFPWPPTAAVVSLGVGLAGLALGVGAGVAALGKRDALEEACDASGRCPGSESGDLSDYRSLRTWSTVGYVVAAAGLVGGAGVWLFGARRSSARAWIAPMSVGVSGAF
jgi:hypothetical protein